MQLFDKNYKNYHVATEVIAVFFACFDIWNLTLSID
jgi:hypothetical protein